MANPMKAGIKDTYAAKFARLTGNEAKAETPDERAGRISGVKPAGIPKAPNQAVPQFENDRRTDDPPYGGTE